MNDNKTNTKLVTFLDPIGRTILGELQANTPETLTVKNPVILHVVSDNSGRMSVQLLPLFFREFLADKSENVTFFYKKNLITETQNATLDFRLQAQYAQLFGQNSVFVPPNTGEIVTPQKSDKVVKLFDDN